MYSYKRVWDCAIDQLKKKKQIRRQLNNPQL